MKGVQLVKFAAGKDGLLYSEDLPKPSIKSSSEVLVRVKAAGTNPVEAKLAAGNIVRMVIKIPGIIGGDFAGIIEETGTDVTEFKAGDEVFGSLSFPMGPNGTYAEYVVVDINKCSIAKKPSHISFEQASSAGIAALTAYQGVVKDSPVSEQKRKVLIVGASGGVGSFGVQIAKASHAENTVVAICSGKNAELVKSLGADVVIDYTDHAAYEAFLEKEKGSFDHIFDCVGGDAYFKKLDPLLKKSGVFSTAVGPIEHIGSENVGLFSIASALSSVARIKLFSPHAYKWIMQLPHNAFRTEIAPLFETKAVRGMVVDEKENIFPIQDAYKAHEKLMSHRTVGKIVLRVD
ncbi:chaperonin 10-like protein [Blakeslea trispora]|nr:chaperonin 10-like protein [Blakeslea trispora]